MRKLITRTAVVGATLGATLSVGVAFAAWSASGSATGSTGGRAVAKVPLSVSVTAPSGLYPTQVNAGSVTATVDNDNPYNVTMTGMTVTSATCVAGETTIPVPTGVFSFGTLVVTQALAERRTPSEPPVEGSDAVLSLPITSVSSNLPDGCADKVISFAVSVAGDQS